MVDMETARSAVITEACRYTDECSRVRRDASDGCRERGPAAARAAARQHQAVEVTAAIYNGVAFGLLLAVSILDGRYDVETKRWRD